MTPDQIERTIEFLVNNQAAHDARLAELGITVKDLALAVKSTNDSVRNLTETIEDLTETTGQLADTTNSMLSEFRGRFDTLVTLAEQTMASVKQVAEAEARTIKRIDLVEDRTGNLERLNG
jgi:methyl-accepting chemotaxis protein